MNPSDPPTPAKVADLFLAYVTAMVLGLVAALIVASAVVIVLMARGEPPENAQRWFETHPAASLVITSLPFQAVCFGVAWLWRRHRGAGTTRQHLGLVSPSFSPRQWFMVLMAAGVPLAVALAAASVMPSIRSDQSIAATWSTMGPLSACVWVLYIGLAPGICEELLFRGLIMRRMLRRWGPVTSITLSSVLFALAHFDPPAVALAFVVGLWQGYLAWRTGSILPSMATHFAINSVWNLVQIVVRQSDVSSQAIWIMAGAVGAASLVSFIMTVKLLSTRGRGDRPAAPAGCHECLAFMPST